MNKQTRWLLSEIERWTAEKIISPEQADRLRTRYAEPAGGPPWGLLVFASAGALVIGLGVILLLAYNWDDLPKFAKLALVLGAVIGAHAGGLVLYRKAGWQRKLGEAFSLLGTMFYGAGIWLVAQIYHIDEHYPNGFLFWAVGALVLAWILESIPQAMLATVLFAIWGGVEVLDFSNPNLWALPAVTLGLGSLAWRKQSALLLAVVLAAVQFLLVASAEEYGGGSHAFTSSLALGVLLIAGARLTAARRPSFGRGAGVMLFFGFGGFLVCAYVLGFRDAADELLDWNHHTGHEPWLALAHSWAFFALAAAGWAWVAWLSFGRKALAVAREEWLVPIALFYAYGLAATGLGDADNALFTSSAFNLMLLGIATMWIWRGCRESLLRPTVMGSVVLAAVVLARYFDLFHSLAARGLAFILLGGIFLAEAMYYRKNRQSEPAGRGGAS